MVIGISVSGVRMSRWPDSLLCLTRLNPFGRHVKVRRRPETSLSFGFFNPGLNELRSVELLRSKTIVAFAKTLRNRSS